LTALLPLSLPDALPISRLIASVEGRHAVILVTDGYDEHSTRAFDEALAAMQRAGASIYVIGIGGVAGISLKGERFLRKLAADTRSEEHTSELQSRENLV